jgi:hypothetical protein
MTSPGGLRAPVNQLALFIGIHGDIVKNAAIPPPL